MATASFFLVWPRECHIVIRSGGKSESRCHIVIRSDRPAATAVASAVGVVCGLATLPRPPPMDAMDTRVKEAARARNQLERSRDREWIKSGGCGKVCEQYPEYK